MRGRRGRERFIWEKKAKFCLTTFPRSPRKEFHSATYLQYKVKVN